MKAQKLPKAPLEGLAALRGGVFEDEAGSMTCLDSLDCTNNRHILIATEGVLLGSILEHGDIHQDLVIVSDDAGQFDFLLYAGYTAELSINKLVGFNDSQRDALEEIRTRIWEFYGGLKTYKQTPGEDKKAELEKRFDGRFTSRNCYATLNQALKRIHKNKSELLLVLERPNIPLHNNASETDIREYAKKRKISGLTRSDPGRRCRDTSASLKKTCRKLGVRFWAYLNDRLSGKRSILPLADLMRRRVCESLGTPTSRYACPTGQGITPPSPLDKVVRHWVREAKTRAIGLTSSRGGDRQRKPSDLLLEVTRKHRGRDQPRTGGGPVSVQIFHRQECVLADRDMISADTIEGLKRREWLRRPASRPSCWP